MEAEERILLTFLSILGKEICVERLWEAEMMPTDFAIACAVIGWSPKKRSLL